MKNIERKNFYELLGVSRKATKVEIKQAYREIATIYHPDSNFFDEIVAEDEGPTNTRVFKSVTLAYTTLTDPVKREVYDATLAPELREWGESAPDPIKDKAAAHQTYAKKEAPTAMGKFGNIETDTTHNFQRPESTPSKEGSIIDRLLNKFLR